MAAPKTGQMLGKLTMTSEKTRCALKSLLSGGLISQAKRVMYGF